MSEEEEMKKLGQNMKNLVPIIPVNLTQDFTYGNPINPETFQPLKQDEIDEKDKPVFKGLFQVKTYVALKRYRNNLNEETNKERLMVQRDLELLQAPQHINEYFIRYFGSVTDEKFTYVATEWCDWCLVDLVEGRIYLAINIKETLRQMAEAVNFVHSLNFIHRNLSPENFRINNKGVVKLTDFRFSRFFSHPKSLVNSGTFNQRLWTAPECLVIGIILSPQVDVFILGCLFFYVLSRGQHPFGDNTFDREYKMKKSEQEWIQLNNVRLKPQELDLIQWMINRNPQKRPAIQDVLGSDYFKPSESYPLYYATNNIPAGLCVIISQEEFIDNKYNRPGSEVDARLLWDTFDGFGFRVVLFKNLQSGQLIHLMQEVITWKLEEYPSLVVCILSHGNKGTVMGTDWVEVSLNQLMYTFNGHDCPAMIDKPKIFIIQACQGNYIQPAINQTSQAKNINMNVLQCQDRVEPKYTPEGKLLEAMKGAQPARLHCLPPVIDFLQLLATVEECKRFRNSTTGSPFIKILCSKLNEEYGKSNTVRHLIQVFQDDVISEVAKKNITMPDKNPGQIFKQAPEYRSSLRKNVFFRSCSSSYNPFFNVKYDGTSDEQFKNLRSAEEEYINAQEVLNKFCLGIE